VAFSADKASAEGVRAQAHKKLLEHVGAILELEGDLLGHLQSISALTYMHHTRRVLEAWVYFKRFAVSVLKVQAGEQDEG
jgi:CRISPR-associated protein Cmr5